MMTKPTEEPYPGLWDSRQRYADDLAKTVGPLLTLAANHYSASVEYGKLVITYLFLANGGGVAGILAIHAAVKDTNHTWLATAVLPAALFGIGFCLGIVCATTAYLNFGISGARILMDAENERTWLQHVYFGVDMTRTKSIADAQMGFVRRSTTWMTWTFRGAWVAGVGSAICAGAGAWIIIDRLSR